MPQAFTFTRPWRAVLVPLQLTIEVGPGFKVTGRRRHGKFQSPCAERMTEKIASTPIASSEKTKKKCPVVCAIRLRRPNPFPCAWTKGTTKENSEKSRLMI